MKTWFYFFVQHISLDPGTNSLYCISRTKSQSLNVSLILKQLSSLNPLKPGIKLRMKM